MRTVNRFTLLGNVGTVKAFGAITKVSIATNRTRTDASGDRKERTDWAEVTILNAGQAQWAAETVAKGDQVFVEGHITQGSYDEGDNRRYTTDLIVSIFNRLERG